MRLWLALVFSVALYGASFPPLEAFPLAWIALAPLFAALARLPAGRALWVGWIWGVLVCVATGWPLAGMLHRNLGVPMWMGWLGLAGAAGTLFALPIAAFSGWLAVVARRRTVGPLTVAAGWGACEFVRHHTALGIPWTFSGYSQVPFGWIMQIADLGGPFLVGMLVAAVNAVVAGVFCAELRGTRPVWQRLGVAALVAASLGYGAWRSSESFTEGSPIRIAVVQAGVGPGLDDGPALFDRYLTLSEEAGPVDLVFWPEFSVDFVPRLSPQYGRLVDGIHRSGADFVFGGPYDEIRGDRAYFWNAVYLRGRGRRGRYEKETPLPLVEAEVLGLRDRLRLMAYSPGENIEPLPSKDARLGIALCSEATDPALVRRRAIAGAEILVNPTNDAWFESEPAVRHQLAMASVRAIENRRYLIRPATTGYSAIVAPQGRILARSALGEPEVLRAEVYGLSSTTLYQRWGDTPAWLALLWATGTVLPLRRFLWARRRRSVDAAAGRKRGSGID